MLYQRQQRGWALVAAAVALLVLAAQQASGQGLISEAMSTMLGASGKITTASKISKLYRQLTQTQSVKQVVRRQAATPCSSGDCVLKSAGAAGSKTKDEFLSSLKLAASPLNFSSTDVKMTFGVKVVSPSIDQRPCYTCTAMAVTSAAETAVAMVLRLDVAYVALSEMDLYYCSPGVARLCDTGSSLQDMLKQLDIRQLVRADCLPYSADDDVQYSKSADGICESKTCDDTNEYAAAGDFWYLPFTEIEQVMEHVRIFGSVVTQFNIFDDFADFFDNVTNARAVYRRSESAQFREAHAIQLVGYFLDLGNFSNSYWLAKNSWGPDWADNGLFKLELNFTDFGGGTTYGVFWKPGFGYQPLPGLVPAPGKTGCCLYKADQFDSLSRISYLAQVSLYSLIADNTAAVQGVDEPLAGKTLLICKSRAVSCIGSLYSEAALPADTTAGSAGGGNRTSNSTAGGNTTSSSGTAGRNASSSSSNSSKPGNVSSGGIAPWQCIQDGMPKDFQNIAVRLNGDEPECASTDGYKCLRSRNGRCAPWLGLDLGGGGGAAPLLLPLQCGAAHAKAYPGNTGYNQKPGTHWCPAAKARLTAKGAARVGIVQLTPGATLPRLPDYLVSLRKSTPGNELSCNHRDEGGNFVQYCRICGGVAAVATACDTYPNCKAFDMEEGDRCGYLKRTTGPTEYHEGFMNYCKLGTSGCLGKYNYRRDQYMPPSLDLSCNYKDARGERQPYCLIAGDALKVATSCELNPACKGFDMYGSSVGNSSSNTSSASATAALAGGYLKKASGPSADAKGVAVYIKR